MTDDTQAQIDRLAERVEALDRHAVLDRDALRAEIADVRKMIPTTPPAPVPDMTGYTATDMGDGFVAYSRNAPTLDEAHEPPHGIRTEADEAAIWEQVAKETRNEQASEYAVPWGELPCHDREWFIHACKFAVAKAIALGLAAPADRAVCEVTDELVRRCMVGRPIVLTPENVRIILAIAAAYWSAGAEAGEGE